MKKFFKKNLLIIIPLYLVTAFLFVSSLIKTEYEITSPGHVNKVGNIISIESPYESLGSFNTTSVYVNEKCTFLQYMIAHLSKAVIIEPISDVVDGTSVRNSKSGLIQKNNSISNSIICAYREAGLSLEYNYLGVIVHTLAIDATLDLEVGDIISEINGVKFNSMAEFYVLYNKIRLDSEFFDIEKGICSIPMTVNNEPRIVTTNVIQYNNINEPYPVFGFYIYDQYDINEETANPKYTINPSNTGGPSGGLMQSLAVYDSLTEGDLTHGLKIAGTGTIDINGEVGAIGGMYSKIFTAYYSDCDIFFVPFYESSSDKTNYKEALRAYEALGCPEDFVIVPVSTFEDAVQYLKTLGDTNA